MHKEIQKWVRICSSQFEHTNINIVFHRETYYFWHNYVCRSFFLYRSLVRAITSLKVSQKNDFIQGFEYSDVISYGFEKKKNKQTISISDSLSETREENSLSTFTLLIFHSMTPCFQVKAYRKPLSLFLYYLNRNREIFYLSK